MVFFNLGRFLPFVERSRPFVTTDPPFSLFVRLPWSLRFGSCPQVKFLEPTYKANATPYKYLGYQPKGSYR